MPGTPQARGGGPEGEVQELEFLHPSYFAGMAWFDSRQVWAQAAIWAQAAGAVTGPKHAIPQVTGHSHAADRKRLAAPPLGNPAGPQQFPPAFWPPLFTRDTGVREPPICQSIHFTTRTGTTRSHSYTHMLVRTHC